MCKIRNNWILSGQELWQILLTSRIVLELEFNYLESVISDFTLAIKKIFNWLWKKQYTLHLFTICFLFFNSIRSSVNENTYILCLSRKRAETKWHKYLQSQFLFLIFLSVCKFTSYSCYLSNFAGFLRRSTFMDAWPIVYSVNKINVCVTKLTVRNEMSHLRVCKNR